MDNSLFWIDLARYYLKEEVNFVQRVSKDPHVRWNILKYAIYNYIDQELQKAGEIKPPILKDYNSVFLLEYRKSKVFESDKVTSAKILLKEEGFEIYINIKDSLYRKRGLLAHELGHTYFFDLSEVPPRPIVKKLINGIRINPKISYNAEEGLPFDFGREILVPTFLLEKYISRKPSLRTFFDICKIFLVSKLLMAKRLYWHLYDLQENLNYWANSILIIYPNYKIEEGVKTNFFPVPRYSEIYRGKYFRYFSIAKNWWKISNYMQEFLYNPNTILLFPDILKYKKINLTLEGCFISTEKNKYLYLLLRESQINEKFYQQINLEII